MASTYQQALEIYYNLRPGAITAYNNHILLRTPAYLQADMDVILAPNQPKLMISDTQQVPLKDEQAVPIPGWVGTARAETQYSGYIELTPVP